ncbi:twin-arginine translocase subunit TatC [Moheibacter lacus]|uniref:Sec-independent protein translocase protein TatC n=1 Tax=Moheibacter lacus TaxID=2745851 RepID=A0A838ZPI4_9FLAO|nr:twin-arginine translocase subunit TatC [Moheibacter lacus]MBA5629367.1 twin-arginine translocase subunit TatC [Moheibacter lacus]
MAENTEEKELTFLGHIYELRGHLIRCFIAILVGAVLCAVFWSYITDNFIMAPLTSDFFTYQLLNSLAEKIGMDPIYPEAFNYTKELKNLDPSGQITSQIYTILLCGLILAIPYVVWEVWRFIRPALTESEQSHANGTVIAVSFFFLIGVLFSYFFMLPFSVQFLYSYNPFGISNEWRLSGYTSMFVQTLLGMGLVFLFPVFAYFLAKIGVLTPHFLRTYRKHALVVIFVLAAVITPSDIMSMMIAAIPLLFLYEFSIYITQYVFNKQIERDKRELMKN